VDVNHFTDIAGFNAISSQPVWTFKAGTPPTDHPFGAYFTTLAPETPNLAVKLRIPRSKLATIFQFSGETGLEPLVGGRGEFIFFSRKDYLVDEARQERSGRTGL